MILDTVSFIQSTIPKGGAMKTPFCTTRGVSEEKDAGVFSQKRHSSRFSILLSVLLAGSLVCTAAGCSNVGTSDNNGSESSGTANIANPVVEVEDVAAINTQLGINLVLPDNAEIEHCAIIDDSLGEVSFVLDGTLFNYRGMVTGADEDISGLYYDFTSHADGSIGSQSFVIEYNEDGPGHVRWFEESSGTVYSVSVATGANEVLLSVIADTLIAAQ